MLNMQISIGMIHKYASSNIFFTGLPPKQGKSTSLQTRFEMVNGYAIPRTSVGGFESNIGIRFINGSGTLCGLSVRLCIFTCLTFRYFTFVAPVNLIRDEWINMAKHMLYELHVCMINILVPQKKMILGRSQFFSIGKN